MTDEEIKQKTSLCFLLNPNIPEEEKNCVIEKVMATKATIVSKAALCNIIIYILKQNAELEKEKCELLGIIQGKDKVIQELKKELNKANEWHYPSKGEYPKEGENVLCYCKCRTEIKFCCIGHIVIGRDNKIRWWSSGRSEKLKVYAWKEIVPPKEVKENENRIKTEAF